MKKIVFFIAFILITLSANAQSVNNGGTQQLYGEEVVISPDGRHIIIDHNAMHGGLSTMPWAVPFMEAAIARQSPTLVGEYSLLQLWHLWAVRTWFIQ